MRVLSYIYECVSSVENFKIIIISISFFLFSFFFFNQSQNQLSSWIHGFGVLTSWNEVLPVQKNKKQKKKRSKDRKNRLDRKKRIRNVSFLFFCLFVFFFPFIFGTPLAQFISLYDFYCYTYFTYFYFRLFIIFLDRFFEYHVILWKILLILKVIFSFFFGPFLFFLSLSETCRAHIYGKIVAIIFVSLVCYAYNIVEISAHRKKPIIGNKIDDLLRNELSFFFVAVSIDIVVSLLVVVLKINVECVWKITHNVVT